MEIMKLIDDVKEMTKQIGHIKTLFLYPTRTVVNLEFLEGISRALSNLRIIVEEVEDRSINVLIAKRRGE